MRPEIRQPPCWNGSGPPISIRVESTIMRHARLRRSGRKRGFVLVTTAISLVGLLGLIGLGTDVGRIYVARNELQVFADEAALAAGFELDGTLNGIQRARDVGKAGPGSGTAVN